MQPWRTCVPCGVNFTTERSYKRHITSTRAHAPQKRHTCSRCNAPFLRYDDRQRHENQNRCSEVLLITPSSVAVPQKRTASEADLADVRRERTLDNAFEGTYDSHSALDIHATTDRNSMASEFGWMGSLFEEDGGTHVDFHNANASDPPFNDWMDTDLATTSMTQAVGITRHEADFEYATTVPDSSDDNSPFSNCRSSLKGKDRARTVTTRFSSTDLNDDQLSAGDDVQQLWGSTLNGQKKAVRCKQDRRCGICKRDYEEDESQLGEHLQRHIQELMTSPHHCKECDIYFAREVDRTHHSNSAKEGRCGFGCGSGSQCTGHHPMNAADDSATLDNRDLSQFRICIEQWEQSQLRLEQSNVRRAIHVAEVASRLSRMSVPNSLLRRSMESLVYSLKSFRSEDRSVDYNTKLDEIERGFAALTVEKIPLVKHWQKRKEDSTRNERIRAAACDDDVTTLKDLLREGGSVDALGKVPQHRRSWTPLMLAAEAGNASAIDCLLRHGADPLATNSEGRTALRLAYKKGRDTDMPMLEQFTAKAFWEVLLSLNANSRPSQAMYLHAMHALMDIEATRLFVASGGQHCVKAQVTTTWLKRTFIALMANVKANGARNASVQVFDRLIAYLVANKAEVEGRINTCPEGPTPLYAAASHNLEETVTMLLRKIYSLDTVVHGENALCAAARGGHLAVVQSLLAAGADPISYGRPSDDEDCQTCCLGRNIICPLKKAVCRDNRNVVAAMLYQQPSAHPQRNQLDYFGALYLAMAQGSAEIARMTIQNQYWTLSPEASTALFEIVLTAGMNNLTVKCGSWLPSRYLVLLDICDALIGAGAVVNDSRRESLRGVSKDFPIPIQFECVQRVIDV